jgi:hypothetical protein
MSLTNNRVAGVLLQRTVVPLASMKDFEGTVLGLPDSNHTDVCKPTNKQHQAYKELLKFVGDILENSKVLILISEVALLGLSLETMDRGFCERRRCLYRLNCEHVRIRSEGDFVFFYVTYCRCLILKDTQC